jgi:Zn-dependent protease
MVRRRIVRAPARGSNPAYHPRRMFILYLQKNPPLFFAVVITVVVSICVHELAHGLVAIRLGDRTPIERGHMTLNPAVHMGVVSVVALLLTGIAWGQMPIDPTRLRGRYGEALVAIAGPLANVLLALLALTALGLWIRHDDAFPRGTPAGNLQFLLSVFGSVNVSLALFNLIPIPPLDGWRVLENFSSGYKRVMEQFSATGATVVLFIVAFAVAGKVTGPAAVAAKVFWVNFVSGEELVWY